MKLLKILIINILTLIFIVFINVIFILYVKLLLTYIIILKISHFYDNSFTLLININNYLTLLT